MARSPSASQLLALISCTTLINCLAAMTGADTAVIIHGMVLSSLFARAISRAPALQGLANSVDGAWCAGLPGCGDRGCVLGTGCSKEGDRMGDEKDSRYRPMKKSSFRAQNTNSTV